MDITKIVVTDVNGQTHTYIGTGYLRTTSAQEKPSGGGMAKIIGTSVDAHLLVPVEK